MSPIPLGQRGPAPTDPTNPTGRLLYLADLRAIVAVGYRTPGGRVCWVVAVHGSHLRQRAIELSDARIAAAATELTAQEYADPDTFLLLWMTRLSQYPGEDAWPGGHPAADAGVSGMHRPSRVGLPAHIEHVARVLAEDIRLPGRRTVTVDGPAIAHLTTVAAILPATLPGALQRLVQAGLLAREPDQPSRYAFVLPDVDLT